MNLSTLVKAISVVALGGAVLALPIAAFAGERTIASGTFEGKSGHATTGGVSVQTTSAGTVVVLEQDFAFDGAPDPKLGFGKNGYDAAAKFSPLRSNTGKQSYSIPANIDPAAYNEIWVWCEKYAVPLGVATLKKE